MKKHYEMTLDQFKNFLNAKNQKGTRPEGQTPLDLFWLKLGKELSFDPTTVSPVKHKPFDFFTAEAL